MASNSTTTTTPSTSKSSSLFSTSSPFIAPMASVLRRFELWRERMDLPNPGTVENFGREAKMALLTNYMFDGGQAQFAKSISMNPVFQLTHTISLGAQGGPMSGGVNPGNYQFGAVLADSKILATGNVDSDGNVMGRANYGWTANDITKIQLQSSSQPIIPSMFSIEHDRLGRDYSFNLKAMNPSPADGTGIFMASYLQSISKTFALGTEVVYQRPQPGLEDASTSYLAKWTGKNKDWIGTFRASGQGMLESTYWQKLADKVEAGAELILIPDVRPHERKALATVGTKYDFRTSTFRAQVDSQGRVSALLEQRIAPVLSFTVSGEIDHSKSTSKWGVGISFESSTMTEEEALALQNQGQAPINPPQ